MIKYLKFHPKKHVKVYKRRDEKQVEGEVIMVAAVSYEEADAFLKNNASKIKAKNTVLMEKE